MSYTKKIIEEVKQKYPNEKEYIQSVSEVLNSIIEVVDSNPLYEKHAILERLVIPDRIITFKVVHENDQGQLVVSNGYRVQHNNALGPYKGGIRVHPSVNQSILKFLAFEQTFKNALTGLTLGGAKGGSDFDLKGKSDNEIRRYLQAYMSELYHHIGSNLDVPAGDIGVGSKEISYLFGYYKKLTQNYEAGVITSKGVNYGGSLLRKEATGYGLVYFLDRMLKAKGLSLENKIVMVSGAGNVALHAIEKALNYKAKVITASDSQGYIVDYDGIDLGLLKKIKEVDKARISEYVKVRLGASYHEGSVFDSQIKAEIVLPCAKENEIDLNKAKNLVSNGMIALVEGANMPTNNEAIEYVTSLDGFLYAPGKAANAGGVSTSALEMSQNSLRLMWSEDEVDNKLKTIMNQIHDRVVETAIAYNKKPYDYVFGANAYSFLRLAKAMIEQGV